MMNYPLLEILCPPFDWCLVNGGTVILDDASQDGGTKGGPFQVNDFAIAKYPITNAQFQIFLEHPNGVSNQLWWEYSPEARQWHRDHNNLKPTAFVGNNLPRTRVSWFDSLAFCNWLSSELITQNNSPKCLDPCDVSTWSIRLPTEQEWQRAALGDTGLNYPWGNELDERHANYGNNVGHPNAVGQYPAGKSIFGVMDMIGNVWEWCLSGWNEEIINLKGYTYRVIKGGAWNISNPDHLRANDRGSHPPRGMLNDCGFRVVFCHGL
jgi:formylglycine-generating enzyme required for sulfatase activity